MYNSVTRRIFRQGSARFNRPFSVVREAASQLSYILWPTPTIGTYSGALRIFRRDTGTRKGPVQHVESASRDIR